MKYSFLLFAVLAVGCARTELNQDPDVGTTPSDRIAFRLSTDKVARANDFGLTDIHHGFNVVGVKKEGRYIDGFGDPSGNNVTYQWNAAATPMAAWEWQDGSLGAGKIWPDRGVHYPLTFFASYPKTEELTATQTTPVTPYEAQTNIPTANTHYNLSPSSGPYVVELSRATTDLLGAVTVVDTRPASGFADLHFQHLLSAIDFQIVTATNYKVFVQSIKIANVNRHGRVYDYKAARWSPEPVYTAAHNASFCHSYVPSAQAAAQVITGVDESTPVRVAPIADGVGGFYTLKLMPQTAVAPWARELFSRDAAQWVSATAGLPDAQAIAAWYNNAVGDVPSGMADSKGWQGARIEVICRIEDPKGRSVIGHKVGDLKGVGPDVWTADAYVRVGFVLDLANLTTGTQKGWQAGYRYTYQIKLSTADASNGMLLDPDYKTADGGHTNDRVDNPHTNPGEELTKGGTIQFEVLVDEWVDRAQTII